MLPGNSFALNLYPRRVGHGAQTGTPYRSVSSAVGQPVREERTEESSARGIGFSSSSSEKAALILKRNKVHINIFLSNILERFFIACSFA